MNKRITVVLMGSRGYIGSHILQGLKARSSSYADIKICDRAEGLSELLSSIPFNSSVLPCGSDKVYVINCIGYVGKPNVDACEDNKEVCYNTNVVLPLKLAEICRRASESPRLKVVYGHVSSGCIYQGTNNGAGFKESDEPNFTFTTGGSYYSGCKAEAEKLLTPYTEKYVWRIRIPFDNIDGDRNYITKLMKYSKLLEVDNSISFLPDVVDSILDCCGERHIEYGTYNLTNSDSVKASQIIALLEKHNMVDAKKYNYLSEDDFRPLVRAPRSSCVLDNSKAIEAGLPLGSALARLEWSIENWKKS
jgi:UDP-glucose 4,6-dehydratase